MGPLWDVVPVLLEKRSLAQFMPISGDFSASFLIEKQLEKLEMLTISPLLPIFLSASNWCRESSFQVAIMAPWINLIGCNSATALSWEKALLRKKESSLKNPLYYFTSRLEKPVFQFHMETRRNARNPWKKGGAREKQMLPQKKAEIPLPKALLGKEKAYKATPDLFSSLTWLRGGSTGVKGYRS